MLAAFSVRAVVNFGKESVKAFQDAEKEAAQLRTQLDSLNLGFAAPFIGQFIDKLALATGKAGGELNAAFISLSQGTQNVTDAQKLLNVALDVSAGTSTDLKTVTTALQRAYLGDVNALARLRIGYTTANLAGRDFDEVLTEITKKFKGSSSQAADTLAGKMARLSEATEQAKEAFGAGFVKGLENSGAAVEDLQKDVISLGDAFGYAAGQATGFFSQTFNDLIKFFETDEGAIAQFARSLIKSQGEVNRKNEKANSAALRARNAILKIEAKNLTTLKNSTKEKELQAKLDKAALALGKGEDVFDLDKIQVQAALLAKQDEINKLGVNATDQQKLQLANDLTRLSIKQTMSQLEDAIAAKDVEAATRLAKKLNTDLAILGALQNQEFKLKDINDILDKFKPKDLINLKNLDDALLKLLEMTKVNLQFLCGTASTTTTTTSTGPKTTYKTVTKPNGSCASGMGIYQQTFIDGVLSSESFTACTTAANVIPNPFNTNSSTTSTSKIAEEIATLTNMRSTTQKGTGINFLLKEQIDTLTDAISTNALNALGDEQARLRAMGIFDTAGIGAGFDVAGFRRGEDRGNTYNVNINAGVIGNEDGVEQVVQRAILSLERKGDPLRYTGGL